MVLGRIKYDGYMGVVDAADRIKNTIVFSKGLVDNLLCIEFNSEAACEVAFNNIWKQFNINGCCDLDNVNKVTGMVMRQMYIRLMHGEEVELPQELDLDERIALCQKIIDEYPDSFKYVLPQSNKDANIVGNQASMRLELLGTYILNAVEKDKECPVMTEYKEKRVAKNEINMSYLEHKWDN